MYEKVNPSHPDKVADRIAGAIVDLSYASHLRKNAEGHPKVAAEVLIGHGKCVIISETSEMLDEEEIVKVVKRISEDKNIKVETIQVSQDAHLSRNQEGKIKCGDNGIFKGLPVTLEEMTLTEIAKQIYQRFSSDGKYVISDENEELIICQSNADKETLEFVLNCSRVSEKYRKVINPLGFWGGGTNTDTGAVNRKLGSDMAFSVTGGGIHGKDLTKADVTLNIVAHLLANEFDLETEIYCAIADEFVSIKIGETNKSMDYSEAVKIAQEYIENCGGFEKFAEWGLVRPSEMNWMR